MLRSKKQPLGSYGVKFLGSPDALVGGEQVVEDHVETQPGGVGGELLAGQGGAGEFVHQHVVGMLDGSGLLAVPSDQIETAAAFGVGAVGDDAELANPVAVAQQLALARADADREITPRRDRIPLPDAVAGQAVDLGPLADCVGFVLVGFPVLLGQRGNAFGELRAVLVDT